MWRITATVILLIIFLPNVQANDNPFNPNNQPLIETKYKLSKAIWDDAATDYFTQDITIPSVTLDLGDPSRSDCTGFTSSQPAYQFIWDRTTNENKDMELFTTSSNDLTLAILEPDGDWECSDQYIDKNKKILSNQPYVKLESLRSGEYTIWIGEKDADAQGFTARLYIASGDNEGQKYNPVNPPDYCCTELRFSNQASTDAQSLITFIKATKESSKDNYLVLHVSIDVIFRGNLNEKFLVAILATDSDNNPIDLRNNPSSIKCQKVATDYCETERLRRLTETRRDYSLDSTKKPIEFDVDLSKVDLKNTFYVELSKIVDENTTELIDKLPIEFQK